MIQPKPELHRRIVVDRFGHVESQNGPLAQAEPDDVDAKSESDGDSGWGIGHSLCSPKITFQMDQSRGQAHTGATDLRGYFCDAATGNEIATLTSTARVCILVA